MPIYLRRETKERPMHDQDPSDSPRLAAADLTEVAGMMRGLSALAVKRGRPLPLNDTSYTSEDLVLNQIRIGRDRGDGVCVWRLGQ